MAARALMFQGTGSDVGKSLLVAGLCRAFTRRGLAVRPFKPQNMSNNAAVTADGGEIGRAQALQARACHVPPSVHMNPVLLKPQSDVGSQIILRGKMYGSARAADYQALKPQLLPYVLESFARLRADCDLVLVEGAGSPAEINLRASDIANMGFARAASTPVVLIGDIDRGGVIAQIVGTKTVLDPEDAAMIRGFLVNKFRGDPALFEAGVAAIEQRTQWPSLGVVPWFEDAGRLPAEDAMSLSGMSLSGMSLSRMSSSRAPRAGRSQSEMSSPTTTARQSDVLRIVVPLLPHIANFDDFDPLDAEPEFQVIRVPRGEPLPVCDLVILPGTKATIPDLASFREQGWDVDLAGHLRRGGRALGICGGYQMLGKRIRDPQGLESSTLEIHGLGLLDVETVLTGDKILRAQSGASLPGGARFEGYEMHVGRTTGPDCARPALRFDDGRFDGAASADGRVRGLYAHGLFAHEAQRAALSAWLGGAGTAASQDADIETVLDRLADHLDSCVDLARLEALAA